MYYLNECSYHQETASCHDKARLKVCSCNIAIEGFSIKKIGLDDFSILNADRQHKCRLSYSPKLTITQKINSVPVQTIRQRRQGESN